MLYEAELLDAQVVETLENDDDATLKTLINDQYAQDIADVLERLNTEAKFRVFELIEPDLAAEVLDEAGIYTTRQLLTHLSTERIVDLLGRMPPDDVVEILAEDVPLRRDELLDALPSEFAQELRENLNFPPSSAGRLMTRKYLKLREDMTAFEALSHLRLVNSKIETANDFYVLDQLGRLIGVVSLRAVVNAPQNQRVQELMERDLIYVTADTDQEEAARTLARYDFLALPVVNDDLKMLGIITVDDALDVLSRENTEDMMRLVGITTSEGDDEPYFTAPIFRVIRQRFVWLLLLFLADTFTGNVLRIFESELAQVVALSFYIPLLIGTGGNTGAQTVSTIIRGMAIQDIKPRDTFRVLKRELLNGLILGTMLGTVGGIRAYLWDQNLALALVIGITLIVVCAWSNTIGSLIPLVAKRVGIDPAIVSAPLITTLVDATGLFIYLSIARLILGL